MNLLVHPSNIDKFKKLIARAMGNHPGITVEYGNEYIARRVWTYTSEGECVGQKSTPIAVIPVVLSIPNLPDGWQLVARREGNLWEWYGSALTDTDMRKSYRETKVEPAACQVCGVNIKRIETFVINRGTERLQVGGNCVAQYIPTDLVKALSAISEAMHLVVNLDNEEFDDSCIQGLTDGWHEVKKIFRILEYLKREPYIPSKDQWDNRNDNATWRRCRDILNHSWSRYEMEKDFIFDPERYAKFVEFSKDEPDMVRILEQDWCKAKDIAYMTGWHRRWDISTNSEDCNAPVPTGRHAVTGRILSMKYVSTDFGETLKITLQCQGYKLYGSVPRSAEWKIGDTVQFTATLTPKEVGFGFYSRPMVSAR
jgi:hypothetical protein